VLRLSGGHGSLLAFVRLPGAQGDAQPDQPACERRGGQTWKKP